MTTAQKLMQRGREAGLLEGTAQVVLTLLEERFGTLGATTRQRIHNCSAEQLDQIARAILTAATLDDVFVD